jgi:hypothetical protein
MVSELNKKLDRGWNPLLNDNEIRGFVKFSDASRLFLERCKKRGKKSRQTYRYIT